MLRRKIYDRIMEWKNRDHKCLLVKGQRQVGKTYIIEKFGRENYENVVILNFMKNADLKKIFEGNLDVDSILKALSMFLPEEKLIPGETLIILDEIQDCPRARTALKFFSIDGRFDVIATGSLLGVNIRRNKPMGEEYAPVPVGFEEHMTMYSLDFEEFLWANGIRDDVIEDIRGCIERKEPLGPAYMDRLWNLFKDFMIIGGMPEAVQEFIDSKDYRTTGAIIDSLIESAKADMNRHNDPLMASKIVSCYTSIPSQLSESNKKFMYSRIDGTGSRKSSEMYSESLEWVVNAGYCNPCRKLSTIGSPLMSKEVRGQYKAYMSDTGMLMHMYDEATLRAIYSDDFSYNMGAVAENVVAECLVKAGYVPRYYSNNKGSGRMELDFVVGLGSEIVVLEVKSGKSREYPSLSKVPEYFNVDRRIVLERSDIHVTDDGVEHYPIFAAAFLESMEKPWDGPVF